MAPRDVRRWLALSPTERALFFRSLVGLGRIWVELRLFGFQRTLETIETNGGARGRLVGAEDYIQVRRYAHWLDVASRHHMVRVQCLHRSLVLHRWLQRDGLPSALRIGVRKQGSTLKAHAWVELAGTVVNDRPSELVAFRSLGDLRATNALGLSRASFNAGWDKRSQQNIHGRSTMRIP